MERRQAQRLYTNLPMECRAVLQDQAGTFATQARMKNISRGGAYLECDTQPPLFQGEIGHFTFTPASQPESGAVLAAKARVRRIDRHQAGRASFGLAVEFLSGPLISYPE